jgi:hypothetical protein
VVEDEFPIIMTYDLNTKVQAIQLYLAGWSMSEIARELYISRSTIINWCGGLERKVTYTCSLPGCENTFESSRPLANRRRFCKPYHAVKFNRLY